MKKCSKCKGLFPISEFHKDSNRLDGLFCQCKNCRRIYGQDYYTRQQEKKRKRKEKIQMVYIKRGIKRCSICKKLFPFSEFYKRSANSDGLDNRCRACIKDYGIRHRKRRAKNAANWRKENPEKYKLIARKANKLQRQRHPKRFAAGQMVRHAIILGILERSNHCELCGKLCFTEAHHYKGYEAEHCFDILWLCKKCHMSKDKLLRETAQIG